MTCQAKPRHQYKQPGWTCTGENLVIVLWQARLPVVVPAHRLDEVMTRPDAGCFNPQPFTGGDHAHLVLNPPASRARTITPGPVKRAGHTNQAGPNDQAGSNPGGQTQR